MNKMEEMIRRAHKMKDFMDKFEAVSQVQDANFGQIWWDQLPEVPSEDVYEGYAALRRNLETTKLEPKESFSTFISKWRAEVA